MFFTDLDEEAFTLFRDHVEGNKDRRDGGERLPDVPRCETCHPLLIWSGPAGSDGSPAVPRVGFITPGLCSEGRALAGRCIAAEPEPGNWAVIPMVPNPYPGTPFVKLLAGALWTTLELPGMAYAWVRLHGIRIRMPPGSFVAVRDLRILGGTNLFWHDDPGDARAYMAGAVRPALRYTPVIRCPNVASVDIRAFGPDGTTVSVVVEALLEPLEEDPFGAALGQPYGVPGVDVPSPAFLRKLGQLEGAITGLLEEDAPDDPAKTWES